MTRYLSMGRKVVEEGERERGREREEGGGKFYRGRALRLPENHPRHSLCAN